MKNLKLTLIIFFLFVLAGNSKAQNASLQVIHNAADPAASLVDVYVDGTLVQNDFAFRTATPFLSLTSGVLHNIGIAPSTSTSVNDTIKNFQVTLAANGRYVAIANGVLAPGSFAGNPDAANTAFTLFIKDNIQTTASNPSNVDFIVVHGATDAPTVDVLARRVASLVDNASYGNITGYISVPADNYILDVTPGNDNTTIVASYQADLTTLAGGTAVVVASGFLDPSMNQNGPAFGLWAYLDNGTAIQLPAVSLARLQVIHNAADPAADTVDVYLDGTLIKDNFAFRTATPYLDVPAGVMLNIGIAPANSTSVADTLKNFEATLQNGNTYVAIANGVITPGSFASNPDGVSTAFTLFIQDMMRESSSMIGEVDLRVVHGASDAPSVSVFSRGLASPLVDSAAYSNITSYLNVQPLNYILDVTPSNASSTIVASYRADLTTLAGGAAVVVASGFLDPAMNQNGPAFGLWAYLPDGTGIELPAVSLARLQVIHNAADPAAALVDVYLNGTKIKDDFAFRTATPYLDVPAGVLLNIGVAPSTSMTVADTLKNFEVTLENGKTYVAIANGVIAPGSFAANPDARSTAFTLFIQDNMREAALNAGEVDFRVVHGSSDAPTVDVVVQGSGTPLVDNAAYGDITSYYNVPASNYILDITPGNNNSIVVASFDANLTTLGGGAAVVLASGFLDPSMNQNGPGFVLMAVLPDGQVIIFNNVTGIDEKSAGNFSLYPNPATDKISVQFIDNFSSKIKVSVVDLSGRVINSTYDAVNQNKITIPTAQLSRGTYLLRVEDNNNVFTRLFNIM